MIFEVRYDKCIIISTSMLHPLTKWAQRKDRVFVELPLMDITEEKVDLTATHLVVKVVSGKKEYTLELELFSELNTQESKWHKTGFHMLFVLMKKDKKQPFWPRLIKGTQKNQYIQIDWAKWVEEDEEEEDSSKGLGGFDPSQMQDFGGQGGVEDQEEGNLDDLEEDEPLPAEKPVKEQKQEKVKEE